MRSGQHEGKKKEKVTLGILRWVRVEEGEVGGHVVIGQEEWVHACLHILTYQRNQNKETEREKEGDGRAD